MMNNETTTDQKQELDETQPLSNTERLRLHLAEDGLAKALLDAWHSGGKAEGHKRMLEAVNKFHEKKQVKDEPPTATEN